MISRCDWPVRDWESAIRNGGIGDTACSGNAVAATEASEPRRGYRY